jgi:methionine synthase II (cobalamin-independent)
MIEHLERIATRMEASSKSADHKNVMFGTDCGF